MYTVVEFDENNKWFVISEKEINNIKYSYLIRVNSAEDDFIDEYAVVKSVYKNGEEFMEVVNDGLDKIVPILVPDSLEYINDSDKLKKMLNEIEK